MRIRRRTKPKSIRTGTIKWKRSYVIVAIKARTSLL
jgi:hypothetical protein